MKEYYSTIQKYQHERVQHNIWNEWNIKRYKIETILIKKMNQGKSAAWKNTTCKKVQNEMITIQEGTVGN